MVIGYGTIKLGIAGNHSLKGKRKVIKSIIGRIKSNFNASVAETGLNDEHEVAEIGFCLVSNSTRLANSKLDQIVNFTEDMGLAQILDYQLEIMHF